MPTKPTSRRTGLTLLILGSVLFVWLGCSFERVSPVSLVDFKSVYYGTRCLLKHCDPYSASELQRFYIADGGESQSGQSRLRQTVVLYVNLPTAFSFLTPFAILPWGPAHLLWMAVTAGSFILAAFLMWDLAAEYSAVVPAALLCLFLVTSEMLLEIGNTAGIVVSFCAIAVWCFLRSRFVPAGILLFAVSLIVKPHDAGLVWLFFFLAAGAQRKRAVRVLMVAAILGLPALFWVWHVAPNWLQELHANMLTTTMHGRINDPGPAGVDPRMHGAILVSLQTILSVFIDNPRFYNAITYPICAPLLLAWLVVTVRKRLSFSQSCLAVASITAFSMVPIYHRQHDTRLLLLTVPAFAILWAQRGSTRWIALIVGFAGAFFTGDMPLQFLAILAGRFGASTDSLFGRILTVVLERPAPLALLAMSVFFLWAYIRSVYHPGLAADRPSDVSSAAALQNSHSTR
jgi:hypothetical protein